jgi:hypothetical protein
VKVFLLAAMVVAALILGALMGGVFVPSPPRFVLVSGNDGAVWRLDNRTGAVSACGSALSGKGLAQTDSQLSAHIRATGGNRQALAALSGEAEQLDALSRPRCSPWSIP